MCEYIKWKPVNPTYVHELAFAAVVGFVSVLIINLLKHNFCCLGKSIPKIWAPFLIKKTPKVNKGPIGENSPNLSTL
jgi:hypothetical protein